MYLNEVYDNYRDGRGSRLMMDEVWLLFYVMQIKAVSCVRACVRVYGKRTYVYGVVVL